MRLLFLCFSLIFINGVCAQEAKIDSLSEALTKNISDGDRIDIYNEIALQYIYLQPSQTVYYGDLAEKLSITLGDRKREVLSLSRKGGGYWAKGDLGEALDYFKKSQNLAEKIGDKNMVARNIGNIGLIYGGLLNTRLELNHYLKALSLFKQLQNQERIEVTLRNIGDAYIRMGKLDSAKYYLDQALPLAFKFAPDLQAAIYINLGTIFLSNKEYNAAKKMLLKALEFEKTYPDNLDASTAYQKLAWVHLIEKNTPLAIEAAQKGVELAEKTQAKEDMIAAYEVYSKILEEVGDLPGALKFKNLLITYKDSVESEANKNALKVYEYEKRQADIAVANAEQKRKDSEQSKQVVRQRFIIYFFILAFLGTLFVALLIYRSRSRIKKINKDLELAQIEIQEIQNEVINQNHELIQQKEQINVFNNHLEQVIQERTERLIKKNVQLNEYAFYNAHKLRAPIATLLGLNEVLKMEEDIAVKLFIFEKIIKCIVQLDEIVLVGQRMIDNTDD